VCWSRANPLVQKVEQGNQSDEQWQCVSAHALELGAKTAYYLLRAWKLIEQAPVPPP